MGSMHETGRGSTHAAFGESHASFGAGCLLSKLVMSSHSTSGVRAAALHLPGQSGSLAHENAHRHATGQPPWKVGARCVDPHCQCGCRSSGTWQGPPQPVTAIDLAAVRASSRVPGSRRSSASGSSSSRPSARTSTGTFTTRTRLPCQSNRYALCRSRGTTDGPPLAGGGPPAAPRRLRRRAGGLERSRCQGQAAHSTYPQIASLSCQSNRYIASGHQAHASWYTGAYPPVCFAAAALSGLPQQPEPCRCTAYQSTRE
jgi:hypothetical protein